MANDTDRTDPELMIAIRNASNYTAWKTFEARYAPIVRSYCIVRGMGVHDADDIAQEVFLRISQYGFADRYDPTCGMFRSYLFRVTRGVASRLRDRGVEEELPSDLESKADEAWDRVWNEQAIRQAVDRVGQTASAQAKVILDCTIRGMTPNVIAQCTGLSRDAVYKARQRLRIEIELACREFMFDPNEM